MKALIILIPALLISACSMDVKKAVVEKKPLKVDSIETYTDLSFSGERLQLPKVTMFLWKENVTAEDVKTVSEQSKRIAQLEVEGAALAAKYDPEIDRLNAEITEINKQIGVLKKEKNKIEKTLKEAQASLDALKSQIQKLKIDLELLARQRDEELESASPNTQKIEELNAQITITEGDIATSEETQKKQQQVLEAETPRVEALKAMISQLEEEAKPLKDQVESYENEIQANIDESIVAIQKIQERVEWYNEPPKEVVINFSGEKPQIFIRNWNPEDGLGKRTFTSFKEDEGVSGFSADENTDWDTITQITYDEKLGKISFILHAGRGYSFRFQFARSDFNDPFKRMNFGGDIVRTRDGESDRFGVIKLSDSKN